MKKDKLAIRNEEVSDIIERMPTHFGRWIAIAVITFTIIALGMGWAIKYPDVVTGQITINSNISPIKLVAGSSGRIQLQEYQRRDTICEGDYIAIIQNGANTENVKQIARLIEHYNPNSKLDSSITTSFPEEVSLGDLNLKYFSFLTAFKNNYQYEKVNAYEQQIENLKEYIKLQQILLRQTISDTLTSREKLDLINKWKKRKVILFKKDMITEREYDDLHTNFLNTVSEHQQLQKNITNIQIQISDAVGRLNILQIEKIEKEQHIHLTLLSAYNDLRDNIKNWEQKYVFKAPINGQFEILKFLSNNQFVQAGEEIFSIVPEEENIIGQMMLPATGAGKVDSHDKVVIKLDNYPYMEYGSVEGVIHSISLVTQNQQVGGNNIETYLITITLPQGLRTNYGENLGFKHEIKGTAEIIVNDRRLIERLFDNLKYRMK